jgi:hypothetical protein
MAGIKWEQGDGSRLETNENSCVANAHFGCEVARNYPRTYLPLRMEKKIPLAQVGWLRITVSKETLSRTREKKGNAKSLQKRRSVRDHLYSDLSVRVARCRHINCVY